MNMSGLKGGMGKGERSGIGKSEHVAVDRVEVRIQSDPYNWVLVLHCCCQKFLRASSPRDIKIGWSHCSVYTSV
jgi:hypothetical protein